MKKQKSFTLIELLVVIAIIGILSGIILVSIRGARERAQRAKALSFSAQVYHALGAYAVGIWDFDDKADLVTDSSGYSNHGTMVGELTYKCVDPDGKESTPTGKGCSLYFDGSDDYVTLPSPTPFQIANRTVSVWLKPESTGAARGYFGLKSPQYYYGIEDGGKPYIYYKKGDGGARFFEYGSDGDIPNGQWTYFVTITKLNSDGNLSVDWYINGAYSGNENPKDGYQDSGYGTTALIGTYSSTGGFYKGFIDELRIYEEALTSAQIKKLYAQGAQNHALLAKE